ncbi:MAG: competence/damage-inducible protein A [Acidobacteriota bacterium]|jgi:nicotinamide-nucleotide amidase|nr:competence/damage-inducible protein A [Acidobacteriota bacterium]
MRAVIIAVGSEMLNQERLDTNSIYLSRRLREKGILTDMKLVVGDNRDYLAWAVRQACKRAQLVVTIGGLGPTADDLTREAVAEALRREMTYNEEIVEQIRERFRRMGMQMPEINTRQAFVIEGAEVLPNPVGTAPGLFLDIEPCRVLLLPGPPRELQPMFDAVLENRIGPLSRYHVCSRTMRIAGLTESEADTRLTAALGRIDNLDVTILASPGLIEIHLMGRSRKEKTEAEEAVAIAVERVRNEFVSHLVTELDESFAAAVLRRLQEKKLTLAVAESCTGGRLADCLTDVPGSSAVFLGGVIAYDNALKRDFLGVSPQTMTRWGAVSAQTAAEMARGVREKTGADIAVSITGIAGPGGGSREKPVGLVFFHLHSADCDQDSRRLMNGNRDSIKTRSVNHALNMIREYLDGRE